MILSNFFKRVFITENKYLSEAKGAGNKKDFSGIDSPRQALTKIHQLTGSKLKKFILDFRNSLDSASFLIKTTPKIDGHPFRVAWIDGKVYFETSYSGLMGAEELQMQKVPIYEKRFFEYINKQDIRPLMKELKKYGLSGLKIIGELLANGKDIADKNGTITYVGTTYDATKIGSIGSIVIIDAKGATLDDLSDLNPEVKSKILDFLANEFSNKYASYFDINKFAQEIDISKNDFSQELLNALFDKRMLKLPAAQLENLKLQINHELTEIFKRKFKNPNIMKSDDKSLEGVAFELNGQLYGIHYQSWKDTRTNYYKDIDEAKDFVKLFLAKLTGKSVDSPMSKIVDEIKLNFDKYQNIYKQVWKQWLNKKDKLIDKLKNANDLPKFVQSAALYRAKNLEDTFNKANVTSDLNSVVDMVFKKPVDQHGKTVAIIPGSFRPPHKGHFELIKHYANIADEVFVVVSGQTTVSSRRPDKFGRTMPNYVAGQILQIYCEAYGLKNVKIRMAMRLMSWVKTKILTMKNVKVMLGVSGKDDNSRFSDFTSDRFKKLHPDIEILPIEDTKMDAVKSNTGNDISATEVRNNIDNNDFLKTILPDKLSNAQVETVLNLINPPSGKYPPMTDKSVADKLFQQEESENNNMIHESGNMFDDTSRINQENTSATFEDVYKKVLPKLKIKKEYTAILGSAGKKKAGGSSGDIDLAIDFTKANFSSLDQFFDVAEQVANQLGVKSRTVRSINLCSYRWPIANTDGKQPNQFVQLDLMPTDNLKMISWGMYSPKEDEYSYKGACRNQLLMAIARYIKINVLKTYTDENGIDKPLEFSRYSLQPNVGLSLVTYSYAGKKEGKILKNPKKVSKRFLTSDPDKIANLLFGNNVKSSDILTCDDAWNHFKKLEIYKDENIRNKVIADTVNQLNMSKITYPAYFLNTLTDKSLIRQTNLQESVDSNNRVAVIITDGINTIVGKAPQQLRKTENCCDLFKGHIEIGEDAASAAIREVYEESGIKLKNVEQITTPIKYLKGTTITFFKAVVDTLPVVSTLKCKSFYEYNGKSYPEIAQYLQINLNDLPKYLYKGLAKIIVDNKIIEKLLNKTNKSKPLDETESIHLDITDDLLSQAKIMAYNVGLQATDHKGKDIPVTPKKFPEKAINIQFVANNTPVTIFLDTETKKWDSNVVFNGINVKLSPEQMGQFFCSNFYSMLMAKLQHEWPLTDELYGNLYTGIANKEMLVGLNLQVSEADDNELSHDRSETHNASGRKYMSFGDVGVKGDSAKYTCWPKQGKEFNWSQWKDWKKIKPLCRMRFKYSNGHEYGISLSVIEKDYENRGFKSYDLTAKPILQWLTKEENIDLMKLSAISKFVRFCANRIQKYIDMDPKDVYEKINNPDNITIEEIINTQSKIRKTLNNIIKKKQPDSFKWI